MKAYTKHIKFKNCVVKRALFFCVMSLFLTSSCSKKPSDIPIASVNGLAFDTIIQISVYENTSANKISDKETDAILAQALNLCQTYDTLFSKTVKGSDTYRVNHAGGNPQKVSDETIFLIKEALYYSQLTDGKVDITVSKVKELWDFSNQNETASADCIPDKKIIEDALLHVDYHNIVIDEAQSTVTLTDSDAEIDLGFIAKGYIADVLKQYLINQGIEHAIINLGGNVLTIGTKPSGAPYSIGIEKPFHTSDYIEKISVSDKSVVTSGVYQRCFISEGVVYHHILDPDTGYPVKTDLLSASIVADSSEKADALSTACILLGAKKAQKLIEADDTISAVFITDSYDIIKINCN